MSVTFTVVSDGITPILRKLESMGRHLQPTLRTMGTTFLSITQGNFNRVGAGLRPKPWPNKFDGSPATLKKTGLLAQSFFLRVEPTQAVVGNPTIYAVIHQTGRTIQPKNAKALRFKDAQGNWHTVASVTIPARPFFPVDETQSKLTPRAEQLIVNAAQRSMMRQINPS